HATGVVRQMLPGPAVVVPCQPGRDPEGPTDQEPAPHRQTPSRTRCEAEVHVHPAVAGAESALGRPLPGEAAGDDVVLRRGRVAPHDGAALPDELPGEERVLPAAEPERLFEAQAEAVDLPH